MPYLALGLAVAIAIPILIGAMRAVDSLESMQADIHTMDDRLATLDNSLNGLHGQLGMTTGQLLDTNATLRLTNRKLALADREFDATTTSIGRMSGTMLAMEGELKSIAAMRGDIHTAVHKISGSFLFKGVK
jgi:hypothetical protein